MKRSHVLFLVFVLPVAACSGASPPRSDARPADAEYVLVRDGRSDFAIYVEDAAPSSVKLAAEELRDYLRKATGAELKITDEPGDRMICLGDVPAAADAGFSVQDLPMEGFRIAAHGGNVYIHGPDTADGKRTPGGGFSQGTLFGVYTFLEKFLDVRWLIPGESGEDVPRTTTLVLPEVNFTDAPDFPHRHVSHLQNDHPEVKRWLLRNRVGWSIRLESSHNWRESIPPAMYRKHPEYFPMRGGKRVRPAGRYKLCTANPGLIRAYARAAVAAFEKNPGLTTYSLSPSDGPGWCECPACTALDEPSDPWLMKPPSPVSRTRRILTFYNAVARLVAKRFPDRLLCGYVYRTYAFPPRDTAVRPEPNVFLVWAPSVNYGFGMFRPELCEQWDRALARWSAMTDRMSYYDLPVNFIQEMGAPNPPGLEILQHIFPRLKRHGAKAVHFYGDSAWGHAGVLNYILAKMCWDADGSVEGLFTEFCDRAYGEGSEPMKRLYRMMDEKMSKHYRERSKMGCALTADILEDVYAPTFFEIERLHQRALSEAKEPVQKKRLDMFGDNMKVLCWVLGSFKMLPTEERSAYYLPLKDHEAFMRERAGSLALYAPPPWKARKRGRAPRVTATLLDAPKTASPEKPYMLGGNVDIVLCPTTAGPAEVTFTRAIHRGLLVKAEVVDPDGRQVVPHTLARGGSTLSFTAEAGQCYTLRVTAGLGSYAIATDVPFAVSSGGASRGLNFQAEATPVYFHVPAGTGSFRLALESAAYAPAAAEVYRPDGRMVAQMRTSEKTVDEQTIAVQPGTAGVWKVVIHETDLGKLGGVFLRGTGLSGYFSLSGSKVLRVDAPRAKTKKDS